MHVPLFITSHSDFGKKSQKRYTLIYSIAYVFFYFKIDLKKNKKTLELNKLKFLL